MATIRCSYENRTPDKVYLLDYVTEENDPRGIPVGYPDPETAITTHETADLTPADTQGKYIQCASCNEECNWTGVSYVECSLCGAALSPGDYDALTTAPASNHRCTDGTDVESRSDPDLCPGSELLGYVKPYHNEDCEPTKPVNPKVNTALARVYVRHGQYPEGFRLIHCANQGEAYRLWLALPQDTLAAMRNAGDTTPVYSHDFADRF